MTLINTPGGCLSNSFVDSVDDATARLEDYGIEFGHWSTLSETAMEFRLRIAAQLMGSGLFPLAGQKVYDKQTLCFPRTCQLDPTVIYEEVKDCQSILAVQVVDLNLIEAVPETSSSEEVLLENALIKSVEVMGVLKVGLQNSLTSTDTTALPKVSTGANLMSLAAKTYGMMTFMLLKPWLTQVRGGTPNVNRRQYDFDVKYLTWLEAWIEDNPLVELVDTYLLPSPDYIEEEPIA
jgi:hypothetical protein